MRLILELFSIIILLILISCTKQDTTTSLVIEPLQENFVQNITVEEVKIEDPCKNVICGTNLTCNDGKCICKKGMKTCNNSCINVDLCCTTKDCKAKESCVEGTCVKPEKCNYLERWDEKTGRCECTTGTKYCFDQKKCLPLKNCCNFDNCNPAGGDDQICTETKFLANICVGDGGNMACKLVLLNKKESLTIPYRSFEVILNKIYEDKMIELMVTENKIRVPVKELKPNEEVLLPFGKVKYSDIILRGGGCKSSSVED